MVQYTAILTIADHRKSYMIYRITPFSITLNDPYPQFQGNAILWRWMSQKRYDIHSVIEILIGTYTRPMQQCHFEWPWVILSDLAKYSMTWSVARSLCDSWASCAVILHTDRQNDRKTWSHNLYIGGVTMLSSLTDFCCQYFVNLYSSSFSLLCFWLTKAKRAISFCAEINSFF